MVTLADLAARPELADELPAPLCGALIIQASALTSRLATRIAVAPTIIGESDTSDLLDYPAAAQLLGVAVGTLHHRVRREPYASFLVDTGMRRTRFSRRRIEAWLRVNASSTPGSVRRLATVARGNETTPPPSRPGFPSAGA